MKSTRKKVSHSKLQMPFAQWSFEFFFLCWVLKSSFSFSWRFLCQVYGVLLQDVFIHSSPRSFILCTEKVMPKSLTRTEIDQTTGVTLFILMTDVLYAVEHLPWIENTTMTFFRELKTRWELGSSLFPEMDEICWKLLLP